MKKKDISVVILARNEERKIHDCLESIKWVDEIIVVDGGSLDNTKKIAKSFGAKVLDLKKGDFSKRRNFGTSKTSSLWILHIDADERISPQLKEEILTVVKKNLNYPTHFAIPRINYVFNKKMKYCGLWPDYVVRLFKKDDFVRWSGVLHEQPVVKGSLGYLKNPLIHIKHDNLFDMLEKTNSWSKVEAELMFRAHHPPMNLARFFSAVSREFWLRFVRQKAFLDGVEGVIYGIYQLYSRFLSYAKLWEMQMKANQ